MGTGISKAKQYLKFARRHHVYEGAFCPCTDYHGSRQMRKCLKFKASSSSETTLSNIYLFPLCFLYSCAWNEITSPQNIDKPCIRILHDFKVCLKVLNRNKLVSLKLHIEPEQHLSVSAQMPAGIGWRVIPRPVRLWKETHITLL